MNHPSPAPGSWVWLLVLVPLAGGPFLSRSWLQLISGDVYLYPSFWISHDAINYVILSILDVFAVNFGGFWCLFSIPREKHVSLARVVSSRVAYGILLAGFIVLTSDVGLVWGDLQVNPWNVSSMLCVSVIATNGKKWRLYIPWTPYIYH